MIKAITNYNTLKDTDLLSRGRTLCKGMDKNTAFPNPPAPIADFSIVLDGYETAITDAKNGGKTVIAKRNGLRQIVSIQMTDYANYANTVARGNDEALASSGLLLTKTREPQKVSMPDIVSIDPLDIPGCMAIKVKKEKAASSYLFQAALSAQANDNEWMSIPCTASRCVMTGLQQGQKYWFRVVAIGGRGQQVCSQAVPRFVPQYVMEAQ